MFKEPRDVGVTVISWHVRAMKTKENEDITLRHSRDKDKEKRRKIKSFLRRGMVKYFSVESTGPLRLHPSPYFQQTEYFGK